MKLTKKSVDKLLYEGTPLKNGMSRDVRWDDEIPGLGVRIYPSGRKAFILSYRSHGRKRLFTIGTYGVITLDQARKKARSLLGKVVDGKDPLQERKRETKGQTFKELTEAYLDRYAKPHKRTWKTDQNRIDKYILPAFGRMLVKSITRNDIAKWHHKIGGTTPYEANRNLALISKIYNCGKEWGFVDETAINPAYRVENFKEEKRDRWVTPKELPKLTKAIDSVENVYARASLWLYLLTGLRKSELLRAKWEDVDLDRREIRLPDTKAGGTHYVPLSGPAVVILQKLPRLDENPYVFPGARIGRPLVNIDKIWRRIRKEAKLEDVRLHDLRRTVGSWLAQSGSSLHLIGKVLGHSNPSTTQVYARFAQDHVREALESHGKRIMGIAGKTPTGKLIKMPKRKKRKAK
ncbi:MAG: site-specific integrase [Nitrospina sp.]|nr:MAG: site-specific integrase [Nitrospina sp.]